MAGGEVSDAYALGEMVYARRLRMGDVALLRLLTGISVTDGDPVAPVGIANPGEIENAATFTSGFVGISVESATGPVLV